MTLFNILQKLPSEIREQTIAWRRHFHQYPELSFQEAETAQYIDNTLRTFAGLEISRPTPTSVIARLIGSKPGKTLALRADIDALPITEATESDYVSTRPGVMHACGHDGHTAMLLATARIFAERKEQLHGEIRFIFQHAEESPPGGAIELVEAGVLDGVDWIVGQHLASLLPIGKVGIVYGEMMASPDNFTLTVQGYGGHAGFSHRSVDTISIGAQIVTNLQHIVSRYTDPLERLVVSVTQFTGGSSHNVIPDQVVIKGTVRSFNAQIREEAPVQLRRIAEGIAHAHGAEVTLDYVWGYHPVVNDEALTRRVEDIIVGVLGQDAIEYVQPGMGGEDFSAYQQVVPGTFINIGAGNVDQDIVFPHHHPKFAIDEEALPIGVLVYVKIAESLLEWNET
ncbi:amidohydrolase [Paenibacillus sp. LS1]|uniref:amidohydrolase n=1 Tax=Paenibacillus sp. LS1 TaxID=2992120 RepID=UPI002231C9B3|nr:amidohydrolase [Paenibacillus sp. LS1]MCW3790434.1 amidohydrolase [Paenibacillus sp. LS1]